MTTLLTPIREWMCPNCPVTSVTHEAQPHTRFHSCAGLWGLTAPMVPIGTRAKVTLVEREDYIGDEDVRLHRGRPIMSIITEREDGNDAIVFAPTAHAHIS